MDIEKFFTQENELERKKVIDSPSGKFRLEINYYSTGKNSWDYSRGRIYRKSDNLLIADIKRNYCSFHHSFVEKDGCEYLITGRSYLNQSIVNLDTGEEYTQSDDELMKKGHAFCWAQAYLSPDGNTLCVDGCYWACSYEFKFFDFTDPSKGWPELEIDGDENPWAEDKPDWIEGDTVVIIQKEDNYSDEDEDKQRPISVKLTLQRQDNKMVLIDKYLSEQEIQDRKYRAERENKIDIFHKEFKENKFWKQIVSISNEIGLEKEKCNSWRYDKNYECNTIFSNGKATLRWEVKGDSPFIVSWFFTKRNNETKEEMERFPRTDAGLKRALHFIKGMCA